MYGIAAETLILGESETIDWPDTAFFPAPSNPCHVAPSRRVNGIRQLDCCHGSAQLQLPGAVPQTPPLGPLASARSLDHEAG